MNCILLSEVFILETIWRFPLYVLLNYPPLSAPVCYSWRFSMDFICYNSPLLSLDTD